MLFLAASSKAVFAQTVTFTPNADAYTSEFLPDWNFGSLYTLLVGRENDGNELRSFIRFSDNDLDSIPADATIESASLVLYRSTYNGTVTMWVWIAYPSSQNALQNWSENTITWNNQLDGVGQDTSLTPTNGSDNTIRIDVTAHVRDWLNGAWPNHGFYLAHSSTPAAGSYVSFIPREGLSSQRPKLEITYSLPDPPDDNYEENDTIGGAHDLSNYENNWLSNIDGLGIQADEDWYKIYVSSGYRRVLVDCRFTDSDGDIDIELYDPSGNSLDFSDSTTDNEYIDYTVPSSGTYYVRVYYDDNGNSYDLMWNDELSDRITVTSPNGGEEWGQNTSYNITWNAVGDTGSYVKIELYSGGSSQTIISSTPNDGSYLWEITPSYRTATDYKILVSSTSDISYLDFSDDSFSIISDSSNNCPVLSNGYVNPASGGPDTHFYWYVDYYDQNNDEPTTSGIVISADTSMHSMGLYTGTASNGTYIYGPRTLDVGNYTYYFYFNDGKGCTIQLPASGTSSGPAVDVKPPPNTPTSIDASDGAYQDKVVITWVASSGATNYEVIRGTSGDGGGAVIGETSETTYDDTTATAETTYYYWVIAKNDSGSSSLSDYDTGYRSYGVAGIPQNLSASKGEYLEHFEWE